MPGIAGFADFSCSFSKDVVHTMLNQIKYCEDYAVDWYSDEFIAIGRADLATFNPDPQPSIRNKCAVFFQGNITNKDELLGGHKSGLSNAGIVSSEYEVYGLDFVNRIKGHFTIAIWDSTKESLYLANDRFGKHQLCLWTPRPETLFFACEAKCIIPIARDALRLNARAITDFLQYQFVLGDETFFEDIRLLSQASILEFNKNGKRVRRYWRPTVGDAANPRPSRGEYCARLHELVSQAVARAVCDRKVGLLLSGGLDSRNIAIHLPLAAAQIHAFTHGVPGNEDGQLAQALAKHKNFAFHFVPMASDIIPGFARLGSWIVEGNASIHMTQNMVVLAEAERSGVEVILEGESGNHLFELPMPFSLPMSALLSIPVLGNLALRLVRRSFSEEDCYDRIRRTLYALGYEEALGILNESVARDRVAVEESLRKVIREASSHTESILDMAVFIWLTEVVRRLLVNTQDCLRWRIETIDVLLDYDLVDFALRLPHRYKLWRKLVRDELKNHKLGIPFKGEAYPASLENIRYFLTMVAMRTPLVKSLTVRESPKPVGLYEGFLRIQKDFVEEVLLHERTISRGLFDTKKLSTVLDENWSGRRDHTRLLLRLLCLEFWFRSIEDAYGLELRMNAAQRE